MRLKADLILFMVAVIWGATFIFQRTAAQYHLAFLFNGASFLLGAFILLPAVPRAKKLPSRQWLWMCIAGGLLFIASNLQQIGIFYTRVANAGFITSLYTVFTPFLLWLGFREKPHWLDALAVTIATLGAYLLSTGGSFELHPGDGLELLGAVFWGIHFVVLGKFASQFEPLSFSAGQFVISGVFNLIAGLWFENPASLMVLPVIGAVVFRAVLGITLGYTLQVWGQRHTPPTDAALILGLEAVFGALFAWLFVSERLLPIQTIGCVVIFAAVMLSQLKPASMAHGETEYPAG